MSIGQIIGDVLILALYGFPLSIAEGWVFADSTKAEKQPATEPSESLDAVGAPAEPSPTSVEKAPSVDDHWAASLGPLADWGPRLRGVPGGLVAGGCLTVATVALGAIAFALYYHFSGQLEKVCQILPRFAYWLPFGLLGLVTDVPFQVFDWEDRRLRVLLRLILWWFPRLVIFAFVFNPPILRNLDPTTTALVVLGIDGALALFFWWLHNRRRHQDPTGEMQ